MEIFGSVPNGPWRRPCRRCRAGAGRPGPCASGCPGQPQARPGSGAVPP